MRLLLMEAPKAAHGLFRCRGCGNPILVGSESVFVDRERRQLETWCARCKEKVNFSAQYRRASVDGGD